MQFTRLGRRELTMLSVGFGKGDAEQVGPGQFGPQRVIESRCTAFDLPETLAGREVFEDLSREIADSGLFFGQREIHR